MWEIYDYCIFTMSSTNSKALKVYLDEDWCREEFRSDKNNFDMLEWSISVFYDPPNKTNNYQLETLTNFLCLYMCVFLSFRNV